MGVVVKTMQYGRTTSKLLATVLAKAGLEDSTIRTLGRWNSAAFLVYIRTPRESLAGMSAVLAVS